MVRDRSKPIKNAFCEKKTKLISDIECFSNDKKNELIYIYVICIIFIIFFIISIHYLHRRR